MKKMLTAESYERMRMMTDRAMNTVGAFAMIIAIIMTLFFTTSIHAQGTATKPVVVKSEKALVVTKTVTTDSVKNNIDIRLPKDAAIGGRTIVYNADPNKNTFGIKLGDMKLAQFILDTVSKNNMIIKILGDSINVELDTNDVKFDTLVQVFSTTGGNIDINGFNDDCDEGDDEDYSGDASGFESFMDSTQSIVIVFIVFAFLLLVCLGVPFLLFFLFFKRMKMIHTERMTALEKGYPIDFVEPKPVMDKGFSERKNLNRGFILMFVGLAFLATMHYTGGFGVVVGAVIEAWGMGIIWAMVVKRYWNKEDGKKNGNSEAQNDNSDPKPNA